MYRPPNLGSYLHLEVARVLVFLLSVFPPCLLGVQKNLVYLYMYNYRRTRFGAGVASLSSTSHREASFTLYTRRDAPNESLSPTSNKDADPLATFCEFLYVPFAELRSMTHIFPVRLSFTMAAWSRDADGCSRTTWRERTRQNK